MGAAAPFISLGGSFLTSALGGKMAQNAAAQLSPAEQTAQTGAQGAAGALGTQGSQMFGLGLPALQGSTNYFSTLLNGSPAALSAATAGPQRALTQQLAGGKLALQQSGIRGGARDLAMAQLTRDNAASRAGLTTGVQPGAASALANIGSTATGQGITATGNSGNLWGNLLQTAFEQRKYARDQGQQAGAGLGNLAFGLLNKLPGMGGGSFPSTGQVSGPPI